MMIVVCRISIISIVILIGSCAMSHGVEADPRNLTKDEAISVAERYVRENEVGSHEDEIIVSYAEFEESMEIWIVMFKYESLGIGRGHFGVIISDEDPSQISIQKGL